MSMSHEVVEDELRDRYPRLVYPQIASLEAVQAAQFQFFEQHPDEKVITLDLRGITDISLLTLVDMQSLFFSRAKENKPTYLLLPQSQKARDIFHQWNVAQSYFDAGGLLWAHMRQIDKSFFQEDQGESRKLVVPDAIGDNLSTAGWQRLSEDYFAFRNIAPDRVLDEIHRWKDSLLEAILDSHLRRKATSFVGAIVWEALASAHANMIDKDGWTTARKDIQIASRFHDPNELAHLGESQNFVWLVWDKGESIMDNVWASAETLEYWKTPHAIRQTYHVSSSSANGHTSQYEMNSDYRVHNGKDRDSDLFFPWLSLSRFGHGEEEPNLGMQFFVNIVCDVYKGTVVVRTDKYRFTISALDSPKANDGNHYDVEIREFSSGMPRFLGNLVAVELPLKEEVSTQTSSDVRLKKDVPSVAEEIVTE